MANEKLGSMLKTLESARLFKAAFDRKPCERTGFHMVDEVTQKCRWCDREISPSGVPST